MKSPLRDVVIPDQPCHEFLLRRIREHGQTGKVALIDCKSGQQITYRKLAEDVVRLSSALWQHGMRKGDVVCLISANCIEYPVIVLAVLTCGATVSGLSPNDTVDELQYKILECSAKYIVTAASLLEKVRSVAVACDTIKDIIAFGLSPSDTVDCTTLEALMERRCPPVPSMHFEPKDDLAALPFSSGTTGRSKGVMLTHHNLVANLCQLADPEIHPSHPFVGDHTFLCFLPFYHIYAFVILMMRGLLDGERLVVMATYSFDNYLRAIEKYKVTLLHIVPPIVVQLVKAKDIRSQYDLSSVRVVMCGAAPMKENLSDQLKLALPYVIIRQGYGLTETSPVLHVLPISNLKPGCVGILVPNSECKVVEIGSERELGPHEVGELWARGPQVMKGYLNQPRATADAFCGDWLRTGDLGRYDEDGFMYIVDRIKELIKYKGFQVAPAYLEEVILKHPGVADVGVVGIPDHAAGELPCACVVKTTKSDVTEAEIVKFVQDRVSSHNKLRGGVRFVDVIPKSASGKILHRILKDRFSQRSRL